jgi:hypothetical protein
LPQLFGIVEFQILPERARRIGPGLLFLSAVSAIEEGETIENFKLCVERIGGLGFDEDDAEKIVGQAFGWGKQAYWLNKKTDQVPELEQECPCSSYSHIFWGLLVHLHIKVSPLHHCHAFSRLQLNGSLYIYEAWRMKFHGPAFFCPKR